MVQGVRPRSSAQALISDLPSTGSSPSSSAPFYPVFPLDSCHRQPLFSVRWPVGSFSATALKAPIICSIPIHLLRCTTITPAAATTDLLLPSQPTTTGTTSRSDRPRRSHPDPSLPLHRHCLRRCHYQSPAAHPSPQASPFLGASYNQLGPRNSQILENKRIESTNHNSAFTISRQRVRTGKPSLRAGTNQINAIPRRFALWHWLEYLDTDFLFVQQVGSGPSAGGSWSSSPTDLETA